MLSMVTMPTSRPCDDTGAVLQRHSVSRRNAESSISDACTT
jgi:hypothetical protein